MENPADILELCKLIVAYSEEGTPVKDAIEQSAYTESELIYELALFFVQQKEKK